MIPPLPEGWKEINDDVTGVSYFVNSQYKRTNLGATGFHSIVIIGMRTPPPFGTSCGRSADRSGFTTSYGRPSHLMVQHPPPPMLSHGGHSSSDVSRKSSTDVSRRSSADGKRCTAYASSTEYEPAASSKPTSTAR